VPAYECGQEKSLHDNLSSLLNNSNKMWKLWKLRRPDHMPGPPIAWPSFTSDAAGGVISAKDPLLFELSTMCGVLNRPGLDLKTLDLVPLVKLLLSTLIHIQLLLIFLNI
jgi:hypothetical protein